MRAALTLPAPLLVFDLGGVVLRWAPAELLRERLPQQVPDADSAQRLASVFFESFRPGSDWVTFDRGCCGEDEVAIRLSRRLGLPLADVNKVLAGIPDHLRLQAGTAALLRDLKAAGHRLVYLSNMPLPYRAGVLRTLDELAVFETGVFSCDLQFVKPEPEIFRAAQRHFAAAAAQCLFFDDSAVNVRGAQAEGWQARRFSDAATARADLVACGVLTAPTRACGA